MVGPGNQTDWLDVRRDFTGILREVKGWLIRVFWWLEGESADLPPQ